MLKKEPKERPTAQDVLSNPWLIGYTRNTIRDQPIDAEVLMNLGVFNVLTIQAKKKLEKSIFSFISTQVTTSKDEKKLGDLFRSLDKNGDGILSKSEIEEGYDALGIPVSPFINELMKKLDSNNNGTVDYNEFLVATQD